MILEIIWALFHVPMLWILAAGLLVAAVATKPNQPTNKPTNQNQGAQNG